MTFQWGRFHPENGYQNNLIQQNRTLQSWIFQANGSIYSSPVIDHNQNIYFGSKDQNVYSVNSKGELNWYYTTKGLVNSSPTLSTYLTGTVFVGATDSTMYAISFSGSLRWKLKITDRIQTSACVLSDKLIFYAWNKIYSVQLNGTINWVYFSRGTGFLSSVAVNASSEVYASYVENSLFALDQTGSLKWSWESPIAGDVSERPAYSSPIIYGDYVFVAGPYGLNKIDRNGQLVTTIDFDSSSTHTYHSTPSIYQNQLYVSTFKTNDELEGKLVSYDISGPIILINWIYLYEWPFDISPSIGVNGTIYAGSNSLIALSPSSGSLLYTYTTNNQWSEEFDGVSGGDICSSSPAIGVDGMIYIGSSDGNLYAFAPSDGVKPTPTEQSSNKSVAVIGIAVGVTVVVLSVIVIVLFYLKRTREIAASARDKESTASVEMSNRQGHNTRSRHLSLSLSESSGAIKPITWSDIVLKSCSKQDMIVGQGSFGCCIRAEYKATNHNNIEVAIKVFTKSFIVSATDDDFLKIKAAARAEAKLIADASKRIIDKECVVRIYGVVDGTITARMAEVFSIPRTEDVIGIVMRFEPGGSLENYIYRTHSQVLVSNSDKLYILKSIAKAIVELHNLNIVHGDLKPANILLTTHSPPEIKLCDFGLSFLDENLHADDSGSLSNSSLFLTKTSRGTPIYKCPEMIVNPLDAGFSEQVARASKKTDMYSFAVLSWELLTLSKPFADCKTEVVHSTKVHQGLRPSVNSIPLQFHTSVPSMIECCWSADRKLRKSATECYSILEHNYQIINNKHFDIFLSHTWSSKPFLSHVYSYLSRHGYRVWYDQNEMRHDMIDSMNEGIENSNYFLACISPVYQKSKNCMFEYSRAVDTKARSKILFLSLEADVDSWAVESIQSVRKQMNFFDVSEVANATWESDEGPDEALLKRVYSSLDCLITRLGNNNSIGYS